MAVAVPTREWSVNRLSTLGRVRLSDNFLMREFLHSEIAQFYGMTNAPDDPDLAVEAGGQLCRQVLEPIQAKLGRISIRSAYRCAAVNGKGAENKNQHNCAGNESNFARHIWDRRDANGHMGAMACVVVCSFVPYYERTGDWTALAWCVHDLLRDGEAPPAYSEMWFFPKLAAFNIGWHEDASAPKSIKTRVTNPHTGDKKMLTRTGMANFDGSHETFYREYLVELESGRGLPE